MNGPGMLYQLALADFRERTRRYSFLITMLATVFFGYLVVTGKYTLRLGEYRGVYNSAWVGSLMSMACTVMLGIFGFYLIKNSVSRDRHTGVGQILATTRLSNSAYVTAKAISNFAVLVLMTAILAAGAVVMQWLGGIRGEFNLWALIAPFLFNCLPVMTLIAATAVLFESARWLRGTAGNILYLFVAEMALINSLMLDFPATDFTGLGLFIPEMKEAAWASYPDAKLGIEMGFVGVIKDTSGSTMKQFHWDGISWSLSMIPVRVLWVGMSLGLVGLATRCFDRFDPSTARRKEAPAKKKLETAPPDATPRQERQMISWSGVTAVTRNFSFLRMLKAEISLMLRGYHWSWYLIALGLIAAQSALPYDYARAFALPAAWIWPLALWSSMGTREARFNTGPILFSSPSPVWRQFPAVWIAGLLITLLTGSGMIVRSALSGETAHLVALLAGALFIPSLALALGTMSGTKKLFEIGYLLIWYIGPINGVVQLDFPGATVEATSGVAPLAWLALTFLLLPAAFVVRRRQVIDGTT
jgi:hypothetical protein